MIIDIALVKEQGVKFAVVPVKYHVLSSPFERNKLINDISKFFTQDTEIILMGFNYCTNKEEYHGRYDIVNFLYGIDYRNLPWKKYDINF